MTGRHKWKIYWDRVLGLIKPISHAGGGDNNKCAFPTLSNLGEILNLFERHCIALRKNTNPYEIPADREKVKKQKLSELRTRKTFLPGYPILLQSRLMLKRS